MPAIPNSFRLLWIRLRPQERWNKQSLVAGTVITIIITRRRMLPKK